MLAVLLALFGAISSLLAVEIVEGPVVSQEGSTAPIKGRTDVECGTRARLGSQPDQLPSKAEGPVGTQHEVLFRDLVPGQTYHYQIGTARVVLQRGTFTMGAGGPPAPRPPPAKAGTPDTPPKPAASTPPPQAAPPAAPPPTRRTWGNMGSLQDHFDRHGADFRATSPDDYAAQAWRFLKRAVDEGLPAKIDDSDGTIRVWDPKTRAFAAYNRNGTTKTYFKPGSPDYFQRQPGRPVKLKDLLTTPRS